MNAREPESEEWISDMQETKCRIRVAESTSLIDDANLLF